MRERLTTAVRNRYRRSAVAWYGAGLGCDCGDCGDSPTASDPVVVPSPRAESADVGARTATRTATPTADQPAHIS